MKKVLFLGLALLIAGCMTPRAQKYLATCIETGRAKAECELQAQKIDALAWQGLGAGLRDAGAAMRQAAPPRPMHTTTTRVPWQQPAPRPRRAITTTTCSMIGSYLHCTTF